MVKAPSPDVWKFSTFLLVGLVIGYGFSQLLTPSSQVGVVGPDGPVGVAQEPVPQFADVSVDDDAFLGSADAPITMIEFSDFQCPYCEKFFTGAFPLILENYVDTGKVRLVYRDYPLDFHASAFVAAEAAECAGEQDKYFDMHDRLFADATWLASADPLPMFKQFASDLSLNRSKFDDCLDNHLMRDEVSADITDGIKSGVSGTPTFFINGQKIVGAQPYSVFSGIFDAILAE